MRTPYRAHQRRPSLLISLVALSMLALPQLPRAKETWPTQPANWPRRWLDDISREHPGLLGWRVILHPAVRAGGLISSRGSALFFRNRELLDAFFDGKEGWDKDVQVLPPLRPFKAMERIDLRSTGGHVVDQKFGEGYVLWRRYREDDHPIWHVGGYPAFSAAKSRQMLRYPTPLKHNIICGKLVQEQPGGRKVDPCSTF